MSTAVRLSAGSSLRRRCRSCRCRAALTGASRPRPSATRCSATDLARADSERIGDLRQPERRPSLDLHLVVAPRGVDSAVERLDERATSTAVVITFSKRSTPHRCRAPRWPTSSWPMRRRRGAATLVLSSGNSVATLRPLPRSGNAKYSWLRRHQGRVGLNSGHRPLPASRRSTPFHRCRHRPDPSRPPVNGSTTVSATRGTAGVHDQVTIVNLTTHQFRRCCSTATVASSRPLPRR